LDNQPAATVGRIAENYCGSFSGSGTSARLLRGEFSNVAIYRSLGAQDSNCCTNKRELTPNLFNDSLTGVIFAGTN